MPEGRKRTLRDSLATSPRRTLAAAGACATLFAASFAIGSATRDDEKRPATRPAQSASITEPAPAARQRAIELGRAVALPPLRKPPRPRPVTPYVARVSKPRSEEHTSELQSPDHLVCRLLLEKKKKRTPALHGTHKPSNQPIRA